MRRRLRAIASPAVAVVAMLPGFILPFVLTATMGQHATDPYFLAVSISLVLCNILGNTIELHSIVQFGKVSSSQDSIHNNGLRKYRRRIRRLVVFSTLVCGLGLTAIYYLATAPERRADFLLISLVALFVPLIGGEASSRSGQLIAYGRHEIAILLQAMRSLCPLMLVLAWPAAPLLVVACAMVGGEVARLIILSTQTSSRTSSHGSKRHLATRGLVAQSISSATMQSAPVADRIFLSGQAPGSISAYELADKVFFAGAQFLNLSFVTGRVRRWSQLRSLPKHDGILILKRDFAYLCAVSAGSTVFGIGILHVSPIWLKVPVEWNQGLMWAQLVLLSLPAALISMVCSRLLIVADRQWLLVCFASCVTVATVVLDWFFVNALGAIGIPVASVILRTLTAAVQVVVVWHCLKRVLGADLVSERSREFGSELAVRSRGNK